jgi:hypothetical protein
VNEDGPPITLSRNSSGEERYRGEDGETDNSVMGERVSSCVFVKTGLGEFGGERYGWD